MYFRCVLTACCHNRVICPTGVCCFFSAASRVLREWTDWSGCVGPQSAGQAGPRPPSEGPCAEYWSQHGCFHNFLSEALLVVNSGFFGGRPYYNSNNLTQQRGHNNQKSPEFRVQKEHLFHCIKLVLLEMLRRQFCNICSPVMSHHE